MGEVASLQTLLATQTVWRAGRPTAHCESGEPTGHDALDALLPQGGWPRQSITELLLPADGVGELSLLLPALSRLSHAGRPIVVVAPPYLPYAPAWQAAGVALQHLYVLRVAGRQAAWAFEQCLRSGACGAVLGWLLQADTTLLRRLQLAADTGRCLGFVLRPSQHASHASPAPLRIKAVAEPDEGIVWRVRKCRGGPLPNAAFVPAQA
ncbi:MAG: translesion DNA synthesis-associated protein ImuA [Xanthomonadales bacterium]|nr:translesion DNA synthesis-associated protein ImuA [Xanthomonadales bacterium]